MKLNRILIGLLAIGALSVTVGAWALAATADFPPKTTPATAPTDVSPSPRPKKPVEYHIPPHVDGPRDISWTAGADTSSDVADWGHENINVPAAWKSATGKGVKVAVLDTGCDLDHSDLASAVIASKDFTGSRVGASDLNGHGTHCAGVIGARKNDTGMVGVAPDCEIIVAKVLSDRGSGFNSWIAAGIDWAVEQGADVISMSLGGGSPDDLTREAIKRATARGVIVVCAAGNSGPGEDTEGYPAGYPESLSVAASDSANLIARFSSRGKNVHVAAPGVNVRSCYPGDRFATMSGTSMATPHVAGVAALYVEWSKNNSLTPGTPDFKKRLASTSTDILPGGRDTASGHGLIQADKLVEKTDPVPPPPPEPKPPTPSPDRWEFIIPGFEFNGRKVRRIIIELEPEAKGNTRMRPLVKP